MSRRLKDITIPVVPDDADQRAEAIRRSREKLEEARASIGRTNRVVGALNAHAHDNHYVQRLELAYGGIWGER